MVVFDKPCSVQPFNRIRRADQRIKDLGKHVLAYGFYDEGNLTLVDHVLRGYVQRRDLQGCYVLSFQTVLGNSGSPVLSESVNEDGVMGILSGSMRSQASLLEEILSQKARTRAR